MSIRPPNIVRGSGVVTRSQLEEEERKSRAAYEQQRQEAIRRQQAEAAFRRRSSKPSRRARDAEAAAQKKADAEAKKQKEARKEEIYNVSIGAFKEAEAKGEKEGIDITSATVRVRDTGSVKLSAKGIPTAKAKRQAKRDAETEAAFETFRGIDKKAGGSLSQLKTKTRQLPTGATSLKVSGFELDERREKNIGKNINRISEDVIFSDAKARRKEQISDALEGARPEYRSAISAAVFREEKKAKPGEMFEEGSLNQFVSDLNYSFDVRKGRGAADDVGYTPVSRKPGLFEGFGTYGERRTILVSKPKTETTFTFEQPKEDQKIGLSEDPGEAFKAPFENIYESVSFSVKDLFGGRQIQRTTYDTRTGAVVAQTGVPKYKAEVEGAFYGDLAGYASERIQSFGKPSSDLSIVRKAPTFSQTIFNFGEKVKKENPESVRASLIASGILFLPDLLSGGTGKIARAAPKFAGVFAKASKGGKAGSTADTFAQQSKDARIAMGLESGGQKGGKAAKVKSGEFKFSKISDADYTKIQTARSPTSRNRFFVNYEPKKQLSEIARGFDFGESGIRSGAIASDEVTIVKEFGRAPVGRFLTERRPSVFGQRTPLSIEEELGLVSLNPSKPGKLPRLADIAKPEAPTAPRLAEGAPIKFADQSGLKKLSEITKPDVPSKRSFAGFPAVRKLPKYTDIIKESKTERSFAGFPEVRKLPKFAQIAKKEKRTPETPFTFGTIRKLPKLGDILKPGSRKAAKKGKPVFASNIGDLLDTLEGKKALEPARNYLTRSEQGALAGDIIEGLTGEGSRAAKRSKKITTIADIDKAIRDAGKGAADFGGTVAKSGKGSAVILKPAKAKAIAAPAAPKAGKGSRDIFGRKKGKASSWVSGLIPKVRTGKKEKASSKSETRIINSLIGAGTSATAKTKGANLLGFRQRSKESILQFPKVSTITIPKSRSRTKQSYDQSFKFEFGTATKVTTSSKSGTRQKRIEIFPNPSRTRTKLIPDIPGIRTPRLTGLKKPPAGGRAKGKGKKPKGGRYQLRSFEVKDVLSATLGTENKFAKDFDKAFGEIY